MQVGWSRCWEGNRKLGVSVGNRRPWMIFLEAFGHWMNRNKTALTKKNNLYLLLAGTEREYHACFVSVILSYFKWSYCDQDTFINSPVNITLHLLSINEEGREDQRNVKTGQRWPGKGKKSHWRCGPALQSLLCTLGLCLPPFAPPSSAPSLPTLPLYWTLLSCAGLLHICVFLMCKNGVCQISSIFISPNMRFFRGICGTSWHLALPFAVVSIFYVYSRFSVNHTFCGHPEF